MMAGNAGESSVWFSTASSVPASSTATITMSFLLTPIAMYALTSLSDAEEVKPQNHTRL